MSNFENVNAGVIFTDRQETKAPSWSFATAVKNTVKRFVTWIDGVDVDGQPYWN